MSILRSSRWMGGASALCAVAVAGVMAACAGNGNATGLIQTGVGDGQVEVDVATAAGAEVASSVADYSSADTGGGSGGLSFVPQPTATAVRSMRRATAPSVHAQTVCTENNATFQLAYAGTDTLDLDLTWYYFGTDGCQSTFSSVTTDSVAYTSADSLDIHGSGWVMHALRNRVYSVSGVGGASLSSDTLHVWNGIGEGSDTSTYAGTAARAYSGVATDTATSIVFVHPRNDVYPLGGTVSLWYNWTLTMSGVDAETVAVLRHVVATLNGTNDVPLQVFNSASGALELTCTLDLTAHRIVEGSCH
jgi:hypothetical protein